MTNSETDRAKLADAAAVLMQRKEAVLGALDYIATNSIAQLVSTEPDEKSKREDLYFECRALGELKWTLTSLAAEATRRATK